MGTPRDSDDVTADAAPSQNEIDLQEAIVAEQRLLDHAPSLAVDGPEVRAELEAGPTEDTARTAHLIEDSLAYGPRLSNLDHENRDGS
jgi:hypothetical protein